MKLIIFSMLTIFFFLSACGGQSGVDSMAGVIPEEPKPSKEEVIDFLKSCGNKIKIDSYDNPTSITFFVGQTCLTEEKLNYLQDLTSLTRLQMEGLDITGDGLKYLKNMNNLNTLVIGLSKFSDIALGPLPNLPKLTDLALISATILDKGLEGLKNKTNLKKISLMHMFTPSILTGEGLKYLKDLPNLEDIELFANTNITDDKLLYLKDSKSLKVIGTGWTAITPAGKQAVHDYRAANGLSAVTIN
jgi:hypothetical protein